MPKRKPFSEQLRKAVMASPESYYRIAKETGIPAGNLSRFIHGRAWLSRGSLDALCEYLDLKLVKRSKRKKG